MVFVYTDHMAQRTYFYRGHQIKPKLDFGPGRGYLSNGKWIKKGWVVVKDHCNVMPGACWFQTIKKAKHGIDVLIQVGGEQNSEAFWEIMQPFEHTPGVPYTVGLRVEPAGSLSSSSTITKGKHWVVVEKGVVTAVGHDGKPPRAGVYA